MKHIVVLGSSQAGLAAVERIKEKSKEFTFTIISLDGTYPANRDKFAQLIGKNIKPSEMVLRDKKYFETNGIKVVLDKKIDRVNFNRKIIFTEDKEQISYDIVLVCDFPTEQWPDIKGTNKQGVYSLSKTKSVLDAHETLPIIEAVVIESDRPEGFLFALGYLANNKDVSLVTRKESLLPGYFSKEVSDKLICALAERGMNIYTSNEIVEILGEGEAKAVKLKSNKVLAADMTFLADVLPDAKFVKQSSLALAERITVDANQRTNIDDVFALDVACINPGTMRGKYKGAAALEQEGYRVAAQILGEELPATDAFINRSIRSEAINVMFFGEASLGCEFKESFDPQTLAYKRLIFAKGKPTGAVLVNALEEAGEIEKYLKNEIVWDETGRIETQHAGDSQPV